MGRRGYSRPKARRTLQERLKGKGLLFDFENRAGGLFTLISVLHWKRLEREVKANRHDARFTSPRLAGERSDGHRRMTSG